jgi:hypothetical protein
MDTESIARRLSFGASKIPFPMEKYLNALDEWDMKDSNAIKISETFKPSMEEENSNLKEYFSKLKFNYLEVYTKQLFLDCITKDDIEGESVAETQNQANKDNFKTAQANVDLNTKKVRKVVKELIEDYETFRQGKGHLLSEMEGVKRLMDSIVDEDTADMTTSRKIKLERPQTPQQVLPRNVHLDNLHKQSSWNTDMVNIVSSMGGVEILDFEKDCLNIKFLPSNHHLKLHFRQGTIQLSERLEVFYSKDVLLIF